MLIRAGVIGLGRTGLQHIRASEGVSEIRFVAGADPAPREALPAHMVHYDHWRALLAEAEIDAVSICVPHHLHYEIAHAALSAGKHVLAEKPLALTTAEGRDLIQLARRRNRVLMVEFTHRFYPPIQQAREWVQEGRLGNLIAIEDRIIETAADQIQPWLTHQATAGGGITLTNGIHMLDRVAAVTGQALRFHHGMAGWQGKFGDIEDTAALSLSLASGVPVQVLVAWPRSSSAFVDDELTIYGSKGVLRVWAWRGWRFESFLKQGEVVEQDCYDPQADHETRVRVGIRAALQEFASAIIEERAPIPDGQAALDAHLLIEAFYAQLPGEKP